MSIDLDGTGDWVKTTTTSILTAPPLTMACWFNPDNVTSLCCLMSICDITGGFNQFSLQAAGTVAGDPVRATTQNFLTTANADSTTGYSAGAWQHACAVITSSNSRSAFLNGGSKGTDTTVVADPPGLDAFAIGVLGVADTIPMVGLIAHAAMWDVALTDGEVAALAAGAHPTWVRPGSIRFYMPLWDARTPVLDWIGTYSMNTSGNPTQGTTDPIIGLPSFHVKRAWTKFAADTGRVLIHPGMQGFATRPDMRGGMHG